MKYKYKLLISFLVGVLLIFFIPIFPVSLPNIAGDSNSIWWNSGLMNFHTYSLLSFFGIEVVGGLTTVSFAFMFFPESWKSKKRRFGVSEKEHQKTLSLN